MASRSFVIPQERYLRARFLDDDGYPIQPVQPVQPIQPIQPIRPGPGAPALAPEAPYKRVVPPAPPGEGFVGRWRRRGGWRGWRDRRFARELYVDDCWSRFAACLGCRAWAPCLFPALGLLFLFLVWAAAASYESVAEFPPPSPPLP